MAKSGVYLECLKSGSSRKRRRVCLEKFDGKIPKKYESGKFNGAMREILSIRDICEFDTSLEDGKLTITNLETISYPVLKRIEDTGCAININMTTSKITLEL